MSVESLVAAITIAGAMHSANFQPGPQYSLQEWERIRTNIATCIDMDAARQPISKACAIDYSRSYTPAQCLQLGFVTAANAGKPFTMLPWSCEGIVQRPEPIDEPISFDLP